MDVEPETISIEADHPTTAPAPPPPPTTATPVPPPEPQQQHHNQQEQQDPPMEDTTTATQPRTPQMTSPRSAARKSVSMQLPGLHDGVLHANGDGPPTPASRKILARKPTPFNADFSESIRRSGINALVPSREREREREEGQNGFVAPDPQPGAAEPVAPAETNGGDSSLASGQPHTSSSSPSS